jgi:hypothetical protein
LIKRAAAPRAWVLIESEPRLYDFSFDAFSSREPVPTSLENALKSYLFAYDVKM